jgi:PAS domain S-box-containing protein
MIEILVVDDAEAILALSKEFLERTGRISVDTSESADAAIGKLKAGRYDAIVSDFGMPGMDGIEFLKHVRRILPKIPFILFTGKGREEVVIDALNFGADSYIPKGGDPKEQFGELECRIHQVVEMCRAEKTAQVSERRLADIFDFLPDATFVIDREGKVIAWNRAMEAMTGVPAQDIMGQGNYEYALPFYGSRRRILIDMIFGKDEKILTHYYSSADQVGDLLIAETDLPRQGGKPVSLWGKASPLYDEKGRVVGAIESIRDITDLKKAEMTVKTANERLNLMNNIIRHDILNQVTVLLGNLEIVGMHSQHPEQQHYIANAETAARMIRDQIEFTREYQKIGGKAPEWQNPGELLEIVIRKFNSQGIRLENHVKDVEILADPLLERVFFNLIQNSMKHAGTISKITFGQDEHGKELVIRYEDDGKGIPPKRKREIFRPEYGRGSGYGLFTSKEILAITGITLSETGEPGKGARFEMRIPERAHRKVVSPFPGREHR